MGKFPESTHKLYWPKIFVLGKIKVLIFEPFLLDFYQKNSPIFDILGSIQKNSIGKLFAYATTLKYFSNEIIWLRKRQNLDFLTVFWNFWPFSRTTLPNMGFWDQSCLQLGQITSATNTFAQKTIVLGKVNFLSIFFWVHFKDRYVGNTRLGPIVSSPKNHGTRKSQNFVFFGSFFETFWLFPRSTLPNLSF